MALLLKIRTLGMILFDFINVTIRMKMLVMQEGMKSWRFVKYISLMDVIEAGINSHTELISALLPGISER